MTKDECLVFVHRGFRFWPNRSLAAAIARLHHHLILGHSAIDACLVIPPVPKASIVSFFKKGKLIRTFARKGYQHAASIIRSTA